MGLAVSRMFKGILKEYTSLLLLAIALITYALATGVGGSGMLAVAICGLVAGNFTLHGREDREELIHFQDQFSEMLRISVFTLLGAQVTLMMSMNEIVMILLFFAMAVLARPIMLLSMLGNMKDKFTKKDILLMSFISPRGLSAAAMIPIVAAAVMGASQPALADKMVNVVFMFIILSVLFSTVVGKAATIGRFQEKDKKKQKKAEGEEDQQAKPVEDVSLMIEYEKDEEGGK